MANNFHVWVDDSQTYVPQNVLTQAAYTNNSFRSQGFVATNPLSAQLLNSALREMSLVTCAIMALVDADSLNLQSSLESMVSALGEKLALSENIPSASNAVPAGIALTGNAGSSTNYARADHVHPVDESAYSALQKAITISTNTPSNSQGVNGDIWIVYA